MLATQVSKANKTSLSRETKVLALRLEAKLKLLRQITTSQDVTTGRELEVTMPGKLSSEQSENKGDQPEAKYSDIESRNILLLFKDIASRPTSTLSNISLTTEVLCKYHALLFKDLPGINVGKFRKLPIRFGERQGADANKIPRLVEALFAWGRSSKKELLPGLPKATKIVKAMAIHTTLLSIHPFSDGNGRVARALEFAMLLEVGLPLQLAHELHNWYNSDRSRYYEALAKSQVEGADWFIRYALRGFNHHLDKHIEKLLSDLPFGRRHFLRAGFSLMEIVIVVLILGILAGVATPRLLDIYSDADETAEEKIVRNINDGIEYYYLQRLSEGSPEYPSRLDNAVSTLCSGNNPCFSNVLRSGIIDGLWSKSDPEEYVGPSGTHYHYDSATGSFAPL